ncbi:L-ribulose-5-phosphate 4-epimerase [Brachybacterium sp. MASK1Z-5]|uniref:L-ribulose-5-phosphate 4-epimerase n=1 Tax=Brachybacterium halotolerans TaxID=2795215 RepID=A0ABS1BD95_9MICO|nr:L-ribulose-5-phosphate 4-epimerase [Brachybacterium halotolerans]MBK0332619.1 L-ribulose-5-phosphate 4-epimerase [Brachybacterium halotolerans]
MTLALTELPEAVQEAVARTRERVAALHAELPRNGLVVWTAGNVSERVPRPSADASPASTPSADPAETPELFVIKPSGVSYDDLSPENMVVCTLDGEKIADGTHEALSPSSDTAAHAYVYRHMDHVGGVVHTHSTYATAWAARGEEIPCVLTMMADEFGGPIPVGPLAVIGDDSIGRGIVETLRGSRSRAVLMRNHGPFTIGRDARDAVKAAVMCEEVARTVHVSRQLGQELEIPENLVDSLFERYQNVYGQGDDPRA